MAIISHIFQIANKPRIYYDNSVNKKIKEKSFEASKFSRNGDGG
jgi:hypothetical protein